MSSATSTEKLRPEPDTTGPDPKDDATFKPWHFFVLASLTAATVAVLMSRTSTPAHLVLVSLTIGAAGAAAAACYRMLAPLTVTDAALVKKSQSGRGRAALEREKALVLRSIKELEFDRAMGKVSAKDFDEMGGRLRARALMLMKQVDAGGSGYRELIERELSLRMTMRVGKNTPDVRLKPDTTQIDHAGRDARLPSPELRAAASEARTPDSGPRIGDPEHRVPSPELRAPSPEPRAPAASLCPACGTANDHDAAFCKRCGNKLATVRG